MTMRAMVVFGLSASLVMAAAVAQAEPAVNIAVPEAPPADQPLIRKVPKPILSIEAGAGVLGYIGGVGGLGPAWNVRVTGEFTPRFALEGNYIGAANSRSDNTGTISYQSVDAQFRYNILLADQAPLQPFITAGVGWAGWIGPGGTPAALVLPFSVGAERLLTPNIKVGARVALRPALFDDLGHGHEKNPPGGDAWALLANMGGEF
jgi:hypothetical protein